MKTLLFSAILLFSATAAVYAKDKIHPRVISDTQEYAAFVDVVKKTDAWDYQISVKERDGKGVQFSFTLSVPCDLFYLSDHCVMFTDDFTDSKKPRIYILMRKDGRVLEFDPSAMIEKNHLVKYTVVTTICCGSNGGKAEELTPWHSAQFYRGAGRSVMLLLGDRRPHEYKGLLPDSPYWWFSGENAYAHDPKKGKEGEETLVPEKPVRVYQAVVRKD